MAEYRVIQILFDINLRGVGDKRGKETKVSESCEWSKNNELGHCTGDWVTVPHDFEREYHGESVVKNRCTEWTKKTGSERVSVTLLMLVKKKCIASCTVPKKNFLITHYHEKESILNSDILYSFMPMILEIITFIACIWQLHCHVSE